MLVSDGSVRDNPEIHLSYLKKMDARIKSIHDEG
jgi:hypothetical protein